MTSLRNKRRQGIRAFNKMLKTLNTQGRYYDRDKRKLFYAAGYLLHLYNTENKLVPISANVLVLYGNEDEKNLCKGIYGDHLNEQNLISIT